MKRVACIIYCLFACVLIAAADNYKIISMNVQSVKIGGRTRYVNKDNIFSSYEEIEWSDANEEIWVINIETRKKALLSKYLFESKGVRSLKDYYLKINTPGTMGGDPDWLLIKSQKDINEVRKALVIGNSNYLKESTLRAPISDANIIANKLSSLGFDVYLMLDAKQSDLDFATKKFTDKANNADIALFYYIGHGQQVAGQTYLIPIESTIDRESDRYSCIYGPQIVARMDETEAHSKLIFIDACRSEGNYQMGGSKQFSMEAPINGIVMFSTKNGDYAFDGDLQESTPFTKAFCSNIDKKNAQLEIVLNNIVADVTNFTSKYLEKQIPNYNSSLTHSVFLNKYTPLNLEAPNGYINNKEDNINKQPAIINQTDDKNKDRLSESSIIDSSKPYEIELIEAIPAQFLYYKNEYDNYKDYEYHEGLVKVRKLNYTAYIDKSGNEVIDCTHKYDKFCGFYEGLAAQEEYFGNKWGYIDKSGNEVIPCQYVHAEKFSCGLAAVCDTNYRWGYINERGKIIVDYKYRYALPFEGGLAVVKMGNDFNPKYGLIDLDGRTILRCIYDHIINTGEGIVLVEKNNKTWFVDRNGKPISKVKYDYGWPFFEGLAMVNKNGLCGFINSNGKEDISCKYSFAYGFSEGLARVAVGEFDHDKWGFIDKSGNEIIKIKYDGVGDFSDGMAFYFDSKTKKYGFINKKGEEVIKCQYDEVSSFKDGVAAVKDNDKWWFIDKNGHKLIDKGYVAVGKVSDGMIFCATDDKHYGYLQIVHKTR